MKKLKATLSLAGLALLSLMVCTTMLAQQPPDDVAGNWTIYSTSGTSVRSLSLYATNPHFC